MTTSRKINCPKKTASAVAMKSSGAMLAAKRNMTIMPRVKKAIVTAYPRAEPSAARPPPMTAATAMATGPTSSVGTKADRVIATNGVGAEAGALTQPSIPAGRGRSGREDLRAVAVGREAGQPDGQCGGDRHRRDDDGTRDREIEEDEGDAAEGGDGRPQP